MSDTCQ
ncbi:hypothetical protein L195_g059405, partial [Trifolium pratense]